MEELLAPSWTQKEGGAIKTVVYDVSFKKRAGGMSFEDGMAAANFVQKGKQLQSREDRVDSSVEGFVRSFVGTEKGRCHNYCRIRRVVQEADRCDEF